MIFRLARRLFGETDLRLLWKLAFNLGYKGTRSIKRHKRRLRRGKFFPPILFLSVVYDGSPRRGARTGGETQQLALDLAGMNRLVDEAKAAGNRFFGILGGEPFAHPQLFDLLAAHRDCYFQIVSGGQTLTLEVAQRLRRLGHVTPLVTIDDARQVGDERRGQAGTGAKTLAGLQHCLDQRLVTGVAVRLNSGNFDALVNEAWLDRLIRVGVLYVWYQLFEPADAEAAPDRLLTPARRRALREFVVAMRARKPLVLLESHYDQRGRALCPAVTGISQHISPWGDIEPCPLVRFAKESIHTPGALVGKFVDSEFLADFRGTARGATRGCILLERPDLLRAVITKHSARDTTPDQQATDELWAMSPRGPQDDGQNPIAEQSWFYWLIKKLYFNDFGTYKAQARPKGGKQPPGAQK